MRIDGKAIADGILQNLRAQVSALKQHGVTPTLAVIQVGDDPVSTAYIRQKQKAAEQIGAKIILSHQLLARNATHSVAGGSSISNQQLHKIIETFNSDLSVHGIIVQRPLPDALLASNILLSKDVDGFLPGSPYLVPVAAAVITILEEVHRLTGLNPVINRVQPLQSGFQDWLRQQSIVVIGRGETAGKPIANALLKLGCRLTIIHSQTPQPDEIMRKADILISCVGKPNVVRRDNIKEGVILISVGISRDSAGKLHGDYEEDEIKDLASFYTSTPGGVGPINVAFLMDNLVKAASKLL